MPGVETGTHVRIDWPGKTVYLGGRHQRIHGLTGRVRVDPITAANVDVILDRSGVTLSVPPDRLRTSDGPPSLARAFATADLDRLMSKGRRSLADLQARVGWDPNAEEPVSGEEINAYIEALEGQVVGQAMAMDEIGRSWRPPPRSG